MVNWERLKRKGRVNGMEQWEIMNRRAKRKEMKEAKGNRVKGALGKGNWTGGKGAQQMVSKRGAN